MSTTSEKIEKARKAFASGTTRTPEFRLSQLRALSRLYEENTGAFLEVLSIDLKKSPLECFLAEINYIKNDVQGMIDNLKDNMQPEHPPKSLPNIMDEVLLHKEPYGVVLIIGPWNYPIQLIFAPLHGAIAAGNCAIVKPSELAPASAKLLSELLPKYLNRECYHLVLGGVPETTELLSHRFDYIFFTGSSQVGKIVHQAAAKFLTPVTLELGGKSPVYLDDSVDIEIAASRILWGKCLNAGQSCIAPDYLLCSEKTKGEFLKVVGKIIQGWYTHKTKQSPDYGRIINEAHFRRLSKMLEGAKIAYGGDHDLDDKYIQPTVLVDVRPDDLVMQEEIFGPILPILTVNDLKEAIDFINGREKPLAVYIFSNNRADVDLFVKSTSSGGVCVNDTMMHFSCANLPFGGVGNSGLGAYHDSYSFDTFTHKKGTLVKKINKIGESLQSARYPPFNDRKISFLTTMMKRRGGFGVKNLLYFLVFGLGVGVALLGKCASTYFFERKQQH